VKRPHTTYVSIHIQRILAACSFVAIALVDMSSTAALAQKPADKAALPEPSENPLETSNTGDPILRVADQYLSPNDLRDALISAIAVNPENAIAEAERDEALGARRETRSARWPTVDLTVAANRSFARDFSNDPDNVIERSRGKGRVDGTVSVQQTLFDFGATKLRENAANEGVVRALARQDFAAESTTLRALGTWYDYFSYSHMTSLAQSVIDDRRSLSAILEERIARGVSAAVDRARLNSALANSTLRQAQFQRERDNAAARFIEVFASPPPRFLLRAQVPLFAAQSKELLVKYASDAPAVRAAEAEARSADAIARAVKAENLPNVTTGVDAGRYGLFEPGRTDYDVRGRITVRQRLFGAGAGRADQAVARATAANARANLVRMEAIREAETAWSDAQSLQASLRAYRDDYIASRITRDAVVIRFRVYRGSLFDVLDAEDRLFSAAAGYIRAIGELDAAQFSLLSRTGQLMDGLKLNDETKGLRR
jgi:outer membrane protein, adhesin transport system